MRAMNLYRLKATAASLLCLSLFSPAGWAESPTAAVAQNAGEWWRGFRVGAYALPLVQLQDRDRSPGNSFLGTIVRLEEQRVGFPLRPHLDYLAADWLAIRLAYERLATRTGTIEGDTDGDFRLAGPALSLRFRYPNETRFTPGFAAGAIWYAAKFEEDGRWGNGFPGTDEGRADYRAWIAQGRPPWPNNGYQRRIDPESSVVALELSVSLEIELDEHWRLETFARYVRANVRGHYTLRYYGEVFQDRGWHDFPHDHIAVGLGLLYEF